MQLINSAAVSALVVAGFAAAQDSFSVITPSSLVQCQPVLITWTGGQAPFFPRITQPGMTSDIIENFAQTSERSFSWTVDQPVGQRVTIVIGDSTGATAPSAQTPAVANGGSTSCLNGSSSAAGGMSTAGSSSSSGSSSASSQSMSSSSSAAPTTGGGSSSSRTSSSSSAAPSNTSGSTTPDSASTLRGFAAVVAGTVGVVVAALL